MVLVRFPEKIFKVTIITTNKYENKFKLILGTAGLIHLEKRKVSLPDIIKLRENIEKFLKTIEIFFDKEYSVDVEIVLDFSLFEKIYNCLNKEIKIYIERLSKIQSEVKEISEKIEVLNCILQEYGDVFGKNIFFLGKTFFISSVYGTNQVFPHYKILFKGSKFTIYLGKRAVYDEFCKEVKKSGGKILEIPPLFYNLKLSQIIENLNKQKDNLLKVIEDEKRNLVNLLDRRKKEIALLYFFINNFENIVSKIGKEGKYFVVITGWVLEKDVNKLLQILEKYKDMCVFTVRHPLPEENPPTFLEFRLKLERGFYKITKMFGTPNYWEVDPTPLITIAFPLFYGIMLSDAGYGLLLVAFSFLFKKTFREFFYPFMLSGITAFIVGILSGNFFGKTVYDFIIKKKILDISFNDIVKISLILGLIFVTLCHLINIIVNIRKKNYKPIITEVGLLLLVFSSIPVILKDFFNYTISALISYYPILYDLIFLGLFILLIGNVMNYGPTGLLFFIFSITGYLSDVLSFLRLAALFITTGLVAETFNQLTLPLFKNIILIPISAALFVILHLINFASSCLSCFVHSLRLLFIEMLPKFYSGDGYEFKPFIITKKVRFGKMSIE